LSSKHAAAVLVQEFWRRLGPIQTLVFKIEEPHPSLHFQECLQEIEDETNYCRSLAILPDQFVFFLAFVIVDIIENVVNYPVWTTLPHDVDATIIWQLQF
jgi:hypothetical protein